jgi:signal transduction histidine kinase
VISVRDNGIGISQEDAKEIFDPFKRFRRDVPGTGMGLGLGICKRIVGRAGGCIWVESKPSKGSTFYFTVRAARNIEPAALALATQPC